MPLNTATKATNDNFFPDSQDGQYIIVILWKKQKKKTLNVFPNNNTAPVDVFGTGGS